MRQIEPSRFTTTAQTLLILESTLPLTGQLVVSNSRLALLRASLWAPVTVDASGHVLAATPLAIARQEVAQVVSIVRDLRLQDLPWPSLPLTGTN
jgi:hypothetical protein